MNTANPYYKNFHSRKKMSELRNYRLVEFGNMVVSLISGFLPNLAISEMSITGYVGLWQCKSLAMRYANKIANTQLLKYNI